MTLIEVVVAMFIFVVLMAAVAQIFSAAFFGYRDTRAVQRDLENAQFAINKIAKALRTSTIVSNPGQQDYVRFYDYSQGICFRYRISNTVLEVAQSVVEDVDDCDAWSPSPQSYTGVTTGTVAGRFFITPSVSTAGSEHVGKVTIEFEINQGPNHTAKIQTTVSLRDYGYVGLLNL